MSKVSKAPGRFTRLILASSIAATVDVSAAVLEEVVVTAQKREQSMQDVGIAVTAFTGDQLKELGYSNAQEVTAMSPGVTTIQPNGPSSYFVSVRGVGQNDFSEDHQESPVAIYVDEAYVSAASGAGFQLFDIERTEVLRGPQGTLFGRNATGGLVHYVTKKPTEEFEGYLEATFGRYDQTKLEGAVSGPLTDNVAGRFSFVRNKHDAYIKNNIGKDLNNGDDWAVRGQLLFNISDKGEWLISARAGEQDIDAGFFEHSSARVNPATGLGEDFNGPDLVDTPESTATAWQEPDDGVRRGSYNFIGQNKIESQGMTSNFQWSFDSFDFVAITDYWHLEKDYIEDSDASPADFFNFYLESDLDQFSQEFRFSGEMEGMRWVAGAFYLNIDGEFGNGGYAENFFSAALGFPLQGTGAGLSNPFETETKSYALFGQLEFDLTDNLIAIAGVRWSKEEKTTDYRSSLVSFDSPEGMNILDSDPLGLGGTYFSFNKHGATSGGVDVTGGNFRSDWAEIDDDLITAKLELDWHVSEDTLLYVSYNRGIKAGGFNAPLDSTDLIDGDPANGTAEDMKFDEEVLNAYEFGFKTSFFDGLARLNGAAYYYDYNDYQAFRLEGLTQYVFNTDAEVKGWELELQASPIAGLDVLLGVGYIDNTVEDAYQLPSGQFVDRTAVLTPEWNINALVRYEWEFMGGMLAVQADATYMDDHYFQLKNSPVGAEDAYTITNARISYTSEDERWVVAGFVKNVTDEEYRTMVFDLASTPANGGFGMAENYYGTPRWWGVSASYKFN
ncbi:TonB-dependent receptor [Pseudomaricurvus albidus]|uniref:TonB-dependent receptor n=1 Tax=Pseudomaricurvus albidus TaxID=2842452 RepID=UPI001F3B18E9|nr:TonB-dependent receptor [Aestuariicella albida]